MRELRLLELRCHTSFAVLAMTRVVVACTRLCVRLFSYFLLACQLLRPRSLHCRMSARHRCKEYRFTGPLYAAYAARLIRPRDRLRKRQANSRILRGRHDAADHLKRFRITRDTGGACRAHVRIAAGPKSVVATVAVEKLERKWMQLCNPFKKLCEIS